MPHIIVSGFKPPHTPTTVDEIEFEFASEPSSSGVVGVKWQETRFLLRWFAHKKGTIIKGDKATQIARLPLTKKALLALANSSSDRIISSTINKLDAIKESNYLKTPHFFTYEFDYKRPLWVEIGFGSGRHIIQNARSNPNVLHIGIEVHKPSAEQLQRRAKHERLENIVVILSDARVVLESIATASIERIFVHFPVPWDDSPTKRVFSTKFIREALRTLKQHATLELRTDSKEYFDYVLDLAKDEQLDPITHINKSNHTISKYEARWIGLHRDIYDLIIKKDSADDLKIVRYDFGFKTVTLDPISVLNKLKQNNLESYLLKVRESWMVGDGVLVQIAIGSFNAPQTIYLMLQPNQASYYPTEPLHTKQNFLAHCRIFEVLDER